MGQTPIFPFRVKCSRCKEIFWLQPIHWNRAERVTAAKLHDLEAAEKVSLVERYTQDHVGSGLTPEQAEDMLTAGMSGPSDPELRPRE